MGLQEVRQRFFSQFPDAEVLDNALRTPANPRPIFFVARVQADVDLKTSGLVLLRLGEDIERRFGIKGEVAAYFAPYGDFQRRSFNAITLRTPDLVRDLQIEAFSGIERFTPSRRVAILVSADPMAPDKLNEWQNESQREMTIVPLELRQTTADGLLSGLVDGLRAKLGERDLYKNQNPVSGDDFFGRSGLLRNLSAAIDGDENVAILGLRRSGKTSVLRELKRQLLPKKIVMPIADFQMLEDSSIDELAGSIASNLNEELKLAKASGLDVWIGNEAEQEWRGISLSGLSDRLKRVAARNSSLRILVAIDEVEGAASIARSNPVAIKTLLGSLRSAAQARENVSLLFCGVANQMFRSSYLGATRDIQVDNPVFGQVSSVYLKPFSRAETAVLLRSIGRPMLLDWADEAVDELQGLTGGYPFFVRDLASHVRTIVRARAAGAPATDALDVTAADVIQAAEHWTPSAAQSWHGIVQALGMHYPSAAALLDPSLTEAEVREWIEADPDARAAADDLLELGLFEPDGSSVRFSAALSALQSFAVARGDQLSLVSGSSDLAASSDLNSLLTAGESQVLEYKQTSRINVQTSAKDKRMEDEIVKTVAGFLNAKGGQLLIGVDDNGVARGIDPDLAVFGGSVDRFERWLRGDLLAKRLDLQIVADLVQTSFVKCRGKLILLVRVTASMEPVWVDDASIFRRLGNQTIEIKGGRETQRFLEARGATTP